MNTEIELARSFMESHPEDAAASLEQLDIEQVAALLSELDAKTVVTVITRMHPHAGTECLLRLPEELAGRVLDVMPRDYSALLLRRMGEASRASLLGAASTNVASGLGLLLKYPPNTAGALMDPNVLSLPEDVGVAEALEHVRHSGARISYYLYVTDRQSRLVGVVNLRELIEAKEEDLLQDILNRHVERLSVHADPVAMMAQPGWLEHYALPVVDDHGILVGLLRYKTLRSVAGAGTAPQAPNPFDVSLALGELYWSTLGQVLQMLWVSKPHEQPRTGESS